MFNQLFFRSDALIRQLSAPLVDERRQYLAECASQGMSRKTLREKSRLLLSIVEYLRLRHRPKDRISEAEIKDAARRWSRHNTLIGHYLLVRSIALCRLSTTLRAGLSRE